MAKRTIKKPEASAIELIEQELNAEELDQAVAGSAAASKDPAYFTVKIDPQRLRSTSAK